MIHAITWASVPMSGAGMSLCGPDHVVDLLDELAGQALELAPRELVGIAVDPPLGAAEGQVDDRRLPGHQAGQRPGLVLVHRRVIPQPALVRAPGVVVLHAIADEVADLPRVELDRHLDPHFAVGRHQERADVLRQVEAAWPPGRSNNSSPRRLASERRSPDNGIEWRVDPIPRIPTRPDPNGPTPPPAMALDTARPEARRSVTWRASSTRSRARSPAPSTQSY